ncbi:NAD(P)/FAD-dependent oxidoreductase [Gracilibacillus sp. YIM 98692]|uniref:NAD(P)/FAD-dependent oxidoreductase n=1 Tax=Gracilibacillus sp. YIM 98692 TaxID=2663532 RepID=UPI0013D7AF0D|nr:NAD(P)/FAD-dependent oxidoreductase [Gracilibacillus sp. YIM 98692]
MKEEIYDLTVIGGGPTGLFATYYATMREMKVKLIEGQQELGGKVTQFFPEKKIYDVGGFPVITGEQLVEQMVEQAKRHQPTVLLGEWVEEIVKERDYFCLQTSEGKNHYSKALLIATALGTFHIKKPSDWEQKPFYQSVDQMPTNLMNQAKYKGKRVAISSDHKIGVGWAKYLKDVAKEITLINPEESFYQAKEEDVELLYKSDVKVFTNAYLDNVEMDEDHLKYIDFIDEGNIKQQAVADELLIFHGLTLQKTPFKKWGIHTDKGRVPVDSRMATNVEGIFAAGDIVNYQGKTTLIASGYTEAITAVNYAHQSIDPKAPVQVYSTVIYQGE